MWLPILTLPHFGVAIHSLQRNIIRGMDRWDVPDWDQPSEAIGYPSLQAASKVGRKANRKEEELLERLIRGTVKFGQRGTIGSGGTHVISWTRVCSCNNIS